MIKNLLGLHIYGEMMTKHINVIIQTMKTRLFPNLKQRFYNMLMLVEDKDKRNK
jgi:hypothetical protein